MEIKDITTRLIKLADELQTKQNSLSDLHAQSDQMQANIKEVVHRTTSTMRAFDDAVELYTKCSMKWWQKFYDMHSSIKVLNEIRDLKHRLNAANNELKKCDLICSKSYSDDIKTLSSEINQKSFIEGILKKKITIAAQKAMCYEVCIHLDRNGWKLNPFYDTQDWGVHLCPNGAKGNRFHYFFMLGNPLGYFDLRAALKGVPAYYKRTLTSQSKIQSIIRKHNLKNTFNPVEEMKSILGDAIANKVQIPVKIATVKEQLNKTEALYLIVKSGEQSFMQQNFEQISQLSAYKDAYVHQIKQEMMSQPAYKHHQQLCDYLAETAFDFKIVNSCVSSKRNQLKVQLLAAEKSAKDKYDELIGQSKIAQKELDSIVDEIGKWTAQCNAELKNGMDKLDGDTSFNLAKMYYYGKCFDQDMSKALQLFKVSYDKGNKVAAIFLGYIYHDGKVVKTDFAEAFRYFNEASEHGYVYAIKELALMHLNGEYVEKDAKEATRLFQIAADNGDSYSAAETGFSYFEGRGIQQNYEKAYKYLKMAMDGGDMWAPKLIAIMYKNGFYLEQDEKEAFRLFKTVADKAGSLDCIEQVASSYYNGEGIERSYEQAYRYLSIAYKQGSTFAARLLALMYEHGYYLKQDFKKAYSLAKEAADLGDANAYEMLGVYYDNGIGIDKDYEKAFLYLKKASDAGIAHATANLGVLYRNGHYVKKNYHKAFHLFEEAAKANSGWGYYNMGDAYQYGYGLRRNLKKAEKLYCVAASLGVEKAEERVRELNANLKNSSEIIEVGKEYVKDFVKDRIEDFLSDLISDAVDKMLDEDGSLIGEVVGDAVAKGIIAAFDS